MNADKRPRPDKSTKALQKSSSRGMWITVGALLAVAILLLGGIILVNKKDDSGVVADGLGTQSADPAIAVSDDGVLTVGKAGAPVVDIWEDFMCPACGQFEQTYHDPITKAVEGDKLQVRYHVMNFLDKGSKSKQYSTRAAAAMRCVASAEKLETFYDIKNAFFENQPQEGTGDRTADELADTAKKAGASNSTVDCIKGVESSGAMDKARDAAQNAQNEIAKVEQQWGTPTVAQNGKKVDITKSNWLDSIISGKA